MIDRGPTLLYLTKPQTEFPKALPTPTSILPQPGKPHDIPQRDILMGLQPSSLPRTALQGEISLQGHSPSLWGTHLPETFPKHHPTTLLCRPNPCKGPQHLQAHVQPESLSLTFKRQKGERRNPESCRGVPAPQKDFM